MKSKKIWFIPITVLLIVLFTVSLVAQSREDLRNFQYIQRVYQILQEAYVDEPDPDVLYKGAMEGLLNSLNDPYTVFIENDSMEGLNLQDTTKGTFGGIGATISKTSVSTPDAPAYVEIISPIEDSPAWKAGLQPKDLIIEIDGETTADISMDVVLTRLRGKIGTPVKLKIKRGETMEFPVTLIRKKIEVPTIKYAAVDDDIGYIRLINFSPLSITRMEEAFSDLQKKGSKKFIIDLRNNPGGLITSAVDISSLFIDNGVIVSTKSRIKSQNMVLRRNNSITPLDKNIPIIVLINNGSASASEIVAGALKDYKRAYLVGETTYGKGSVQQIIDINEKMSFKMTIARYYTPSDANIDNLGIPPDREVKFPELTEEQEKSLMTLVQTPKISDYVKKNKKRNQSNVKTFANQLAKEYILDAWIVERLIVLEYRKSEEMPVFDLEYDIQLQEALKILRTENIAQLVKKTKSVHELQTTAQAKEEKATPTKKK